MNTQTMRASKTLAFASVPGLMAAAALGSYRRAVRELDGHPAAPPNLPGRVRILTTRWGRIAYRKIDGDPNAGPPVVLVHGWGRTAESAWWPLLGRIQAPVVAVDLPGHGRSLLEAPFSFELAAHSILTVIQDAGLEQPMLVAHSMGGPVALTTVRRAGAEAFSGMVALATSSHWVRPRNRLMVAGAPYVLAPRSPILIRAQRKEQRLAPEHAPRIAWEYAVRPNRRVLVEAAMELRRFDARKWNGFELPPTIWVITLADGVIHPQEQRESARHFGVPAVAVPTDHSVVAEAPDLIVRVVKTNGDRPQGPVMVAI